jgi:flagellar motor switch protein FliN
MSEIQEEQISQIVEACQGQAEVISGCLNSCLESDFQFDIGEQAALSLDSLPPELDAPGMVVVLTIENQHVVCLIPESLPLPEWYKTPDETQSSRLQTIGMEWSMCMLPATMECSSFETITLSNLRSFLEEGDPAEGAFTLALNIKQEGDTPAIDTTASDSTDEKPEETSAEETDAETSEEESAEKSEEVAEVDEGEKPVSGSGPFMWLVGPLNNISKEEEAPAENSETSASEEAGADVASETAPDSTVHQDQTPSEGKQFASQDGINRFRKMPVTISVRLASKRIELGEFLAITPGTLITFDKSCDDPLELYVNNYRYCQGEAVKIGENFGLKVEEVGVQDVREDRII